MVSPQSNRSCSACYLIDFHVAGKRKLFNEIRYPIIQPLAHHMPAYGPVEQIVIAAVITAATAAAKQQGFTTVIIQKKFNRVFEIFINFAGILFKHFRRLTTTRANIERHLFGSHDINSGRLYLGGIANIAGVVHPDNNHIFDQ